MEEQLPIIESHMYEFVEDLTAPTSLKEAMLYSLKAGGKRVRPLFVIAVLDYLNKPTKAGIQ